MPKAVAEVDGRGGTENALTGSKVEVGDNIDVVWVPSPCVLNSRASLFSYISNSILPPTSPPCVSLVSKETDGPSN